MRYLTEHLAAEGSQPLTVVALDQPMPGYAQCRYDIAGFNTVYNQAAQTPNGQPAYFSRLPIIFQTNADAVDFQIPDGVSVESLIAIVADHLLSLQQTPGACMENQLAFEHLNQSLKVLTTRRQRIVAEQTQLRQHFQIDESRRYAA